MNNARNNARKNNAQRTKVQKQPPSSLTAVVVDEDRVRIIGPMSEANAVPLLACAADDPACWSDLLLLWPRYRFDDSGEFLESLPIRERAIEGEPVGGAIDWAVAAAAASECWFAIDLVGRRLLTGRRHPRLCLDGSRRGDDADAEIVVLPPWWELCQQVGPVTIGQVRSDPPLPDPPRRDVLWGATITEFFADRMLAIIESGQDWIEKDRPGGPGGRYALTVSVHRDWLMTPRPELDGGIPRQQLHGPRSWIASLAGCQEYRLYEGEQPVPISEELSSYETAPIGDHEMSVYFDACRETITEGWRWLMEDAERTRGESARADLAAAMDRFLGRWLQQSFEGEETPAEVIRAERLRVPLVDNGARHIDCNCPICAMMGSFGPSIIRLDGHRLELDEDYAFSMCEDRFQWQQQQQEWSELSANIDAKLQQRAKDGDDQEDEEAYGSVWGNSFLSADGIPGDTRGHLGLAFLLAEIVGALETSGADQADIDRLNSAFRIYREATESCPDESAAEAFKETLEQLAQRHPYLVSRSADLQSRIDELVRLPG